MKPKSDHEILVNTILETKKQERSQLLKSLVEEVEGMKMKHDESVDVRQTRGNITLENCVCGAWEHNQALDDVSKMIKEKYERKRLPG